MTLTLGDDEVFRLRELVLERAGQADLPLTDANVDSVELVLVLREDDSEAFAGPMTYEPATGDWLGDVPSADTADLLFRREYRAVAVVTVEGKRHSVVVDVTTRKGAGV